MSARTAFVTGGMSSILVKGIAIGLEKRTSMDKNGKLQAVAEQEYLLLWLEQKRYVLSEKAGG